MVGDKLMTLVVYFVQSTGLITLLSSIEKRKASGLQHEAPIVARLPYGCFLSAIALY